MVENRGAPMAQLFPGKKFITFGGDGQQRQARRAGSHRGWLRIASPIRRRRLQITKP
jgi:hypothetical protein